MARVITGSDFAIGYAEAGGGEATPLVFLHGVGSDKSVWHPQLEYFGSRRRTIAFDYPGYGESEAAEPGTTRDDYAAAIISAMHELGIDAAHICGLSLGGVIAIAMHHLARQCCASLILADTFAVHPEGQSIYERSSAASNDLRALAEARVDVLIAQPSDPQVRSEIVETMARIDPGAYRIGAEAVWLADQRERAAAINIPTLILVGEEDFVTPPVLSNELADLIANARMEAIPGAGHLTNLEKSDEFNERVGHFLTEVEA